MINRVLHLLSILSVDVSIYAHTYVQVRYNLNCTVYEIEMYVEYVYHYHLISTAAV